MAEHDHTQNVPGKQADSARRLMRELEELLSLKKQVSFEQMLQAYRGAGEDVEDLKADMQALEEKLELWRRRIEFEQAKRGLR